MTGIPMGYARKTWRQKLEDDKGLPRVCPIDETRSKRWGEGTFVIPAPREVDELMRSVPKGRLITIDELRRALATRHRATIACPLTTGIFAWIAAHAAAEAQSQGARRITPYWRTLKAGGELNPRYPGGLDSLAKLLEAEGHEVIFKRKRCFVSNYEKKVFGRLGTVKGA